MVVQNVVYDLHVVLIAHAGAISAAAGDINVPSPIIAAACLSALGEKKYTRR
jgi:hypothetical protein